MNRFLDVVLYAADGSNLHGNWARQPDPSAAGGQVMASVDRGWAHTVAPLQAPVDYFDFTFAAPAATSYHVWLRMHATGNSKYNDSVFVQFSDALAPGGHPVFGMGTTSGLCVNLASDASASSLAGWGWKDGAYWAAQTSTIAFASSGTHTLLGSANENSAGPSSGRGGLTYALRSLIAAYDIGAAIVFDTMVKSFDRSPGETVRKPAGLSTT